MRPFQVKGPALISFSGGRTSAMMLHQILAQCGGELAPDVHVVFADTFKERAETYDFVDECEFRWDVHMHHVARPGGFEQLIREKRYLPNVVARFCTSELKIVPMRDFMLERGYDTWTMVVGLRADEPHRAARLKSDDWDYQFPLLDAGVALDDVQAFWERQPFDLKLRPHEGNCDLCFMKGRNKRVRILADRPDLGDWWARQEMRVGATFDKSMSVATLQERATVSRRQLSLPLVDEPTMSCFCGD